MSVCNLVTLWASLRNHVPLPGADKLEALGGRLVDSTWVCLCHSERELKDQGQHGKASYFRVRGIDHNITQDPWARDPPRILAY